MKRFSPDSNLETRHTELISDLDVFQPTEDVKQELNPIDDVNTIPEYMITQPEFVGYPTLELQESVYHCAAFSTLNTDTVSVLDIGCGRGDFGKYIKDNINPNIQYVGIDMNPLTITAGNEKYGTELNDLGFTLRTAVYSPNTYEDSNKYDWVFHIMDLAIDYGVYPNITINNTEKYNYLKDLIVKSINQSEIGIVFILLNDHPLNAGFLQFSFSEISNILFELGYRFAIDNSDFPNMFKLVIFNKTF